MQTRKIEILNNLLGKSYKTGDERLFFCPKCQHHKAKLSINLNKNKFKCWICNFSGNILNLIKFFNNKEYIAEWKKLTGEVDLANTDKLTITFDKPSKKQEVFFELPKEFISLVGNKRPDATFAMNYLYKRGLTLKDINHWKIGYATSGEYKDRIIFPSFDKYGKLNYFVARSFTDDKKKYKNPEVTKDIVFNELNIDFSKPVILVEGVLDAIKAGINSIPILGSSLKEDSNIFNLLASKCNRVFLALDPDAKKKEMYLMKNLMAYGLEICKILVEPFKDVGEMTKEEFQARKDNATCVDNKKFMLMRF